MSSDQPLLRPAIRIIAGMLGLVLLIVLIVEFRQASAFNALSGILVISLLGWGAITGRSPQWLEDLRGRRRG